MKVKEGFKKELKRAGGDVVGGILKRVLGEVVKEEKEQSRKNTIEFLREEGILPKVRRGEVMGKDPFLEDEGFVYSSDTSEDSSGQKNVSYSDFSRKDNEGRQNSFKTGRPLRSKERTFSNSPRRKENRKILQRQIIKPIYPEGVSFPKLNELVKNSKLHYKEEEKDPSKKKRDDISNIGKAESSSILSLTFSKRETSNKPPLTKENKPNGSHKITYQGSNSKSQFE